MTYLETTSKIVAPFLIAVATSASFGTLVSALAAFSSFFCMVTSVDRYTLQPVRESKYVALKPLQVHSTLRESKSVTLKPL